MRWTPMTMAASLALALVATGVPSGRAQDQASDPHHQAAQAQSTAPAPQTGAPQPPATTGQAAVGGSGMPMMAEMMGQMMRQMMAQTGAPLMGMMVRGADPFSGLPLERVEGRLAFVKAELGITESQMPQWEASAAMLRASAGKLLVEVQALRKAPAPTTALEQLDRFEQSNTLLLEAIRACRTAFTPLYAVLDDAQKRTADELMLGAMGVGQIGPVM